MISNEKKFETPTRFIKAREKLKKIIDEILLEEPALKPLLNAREILAA